MKLSLSGVLNFFKQLEFNEVINMARLVTGQLNQMKIFSYHCHLTLRNKKFMFKVETSFSDVANGIFNSKKAFDAGIIVSMIAESLFDGEAIRILDYSGTADNYFEMTLTLTAENH